MPTAALVEPPASAGAAGTEPHLPESGEPHAGLPPLLAVVHHPPNERSSCSARDSTTPANCPSARTPGSAVSAASASAMASIAASQTGDLAQLERLLAGDVGAKSPLAVAA